jgi:hypothetical protein
VADDAADGCTADGSDRAAVGQNGTANGAYASANRGVFILCRHVGTPSEPNSMAAATVLNVNLCIVFMGQLLF